MPKLKTNKSAAKRYKITANGKVKRRKAFARHILTKKSQARKRSLRRSVVLDPADSPRVKRLMPYG